MSVKESKQTVEQNKQLENAIMCGIDNITQKPTREERQVLRYALIFFLKYRSTRLSKRAQPKHSTAQTTTQLESCSFFFLAPRINLKQKTFLKVQQ